MKVRRKIMGLFYDDMMKGFQRKKDMSADMMRKDLKRCFSMVDLTFLAISGMVGSGLYVLAGTVAKNTAGPSIVIAYILAAIASVLSATCYAEFAARVPVAGSAYQFTYLSIGELWAFIIGWNVAIEHAIYLSATAKSCASYIDQLANGTIEAYLNKHMHMGSKFFAPHPDFMAAGLILLFAATLLLGVKISSKINIVISLVNLLVLLFIMATGFAFAKAENWTNDFFPYGWSGTLKGASTLVFSYVGYEMIASATEEAVNAARDIPISLGIAVSVVMLAYVGGSASLTLMVPYNLIDPTAPFPSAYDYCHVYWAKYVISIGALAAMLACLLAILFVVPRYLLAMSRDGLLWEFLGRVHPITQVPHIATMTVAGVSMVMATFISLQTLVEFIAIGQLLACTFVAICVIKLRYSPNNISSYSRADMSDYEDNNSTSTLAMRQLGLSISYKDLSNKDDVHLTKRNPGATGDEDGDSETITEKQDIEETRSRESSNGSGGIVERSNDPINRSNSFGNNESFFLLGQNNCGTVKKSIINSPYGFLFSWTNAYQPGVVVFNSLMISVSCGAICCALLLFVPSKTLVQPFVVIPLVSLAIVAVSTLALITAFNPDTSIKTFKVPLVPLVPYLSIIINVTLILKLDPLTWLRLAIWIIIGLIIYGTYGFKNSKLAQQQPAESTDV